MDRMNDLVELVEVAIDGKVTGFYDEVTRDTKCVARFSQDACELILPRKPTKRRTPSKDGLNSEAICRCLVEHGFTCATPVRYDTSEAKMRCASNGQKIIVTLA